MIHMPARSVRRSALALVVGAGLTLGACSPLAFPEAAPALPERRRASGRRSIMASPSWDRRWASSRHACHRMERAFRSTTVSPFTARPTASQFKLFVLGALANEIAAGRISWDQTLTVTDAVRSIGNGPGSLQFAASGTQVSVEETATKMISISDNTAADMLIGLLGRNRVEAQVRQWAANASANEPFLTTREMILLHYVAGLGDRYLATPRREREAFLASSVDPLPISAIVSGYSRTLAMSNRSSGSPPPMTSAARSPACSGCRRTRGCLPCPRSFPFKWPGSDWSRRHGRPSGTRAARSPASSPSAGSPPTVAGRPSSSRRW